MTNIRSNELSDVELEAVAGGDYTISEQTGQKINSVSAGAAALATGSVLAISAYIIAGTNYLAGFATADHNK